MAKFTVVEADGTQVKFEGKHRLADNGTLKVTPDEGNVITYSQVGWLALEVTEASEKSGRPRRGIIIAE